MARFEGSSLQGTATTTVDASNTAESMKSGSLAVFSTPSMVALMEQAACAAIASALTEGETSVGTAVNISHLAPTPVGCSITATAVSVAGTEREITFEVTASDSSGQKIGEGTHKRVVVKVDRFMQKANEKLQPPQ
mmetsp:Transcript_23752/g.56641  ORF Transcript_23752/g.56641 Transcript_23752/m.56641 type:complete len:136 (-) Transcript_23752:23-430(-)